MEKVVFERQAQRVTAVWTFAPAQQTVKIPAYTTKATLVDKLGNKRAIESRNGIYTITLDRATANSDLANPANYIVGGSPLLLVEDNPSATALPTTTTQSKPSQSLSLANPDVDERFAAYYKTHDGPRLLGAPIGPSVEQDGRFVQYFEKGRIEDYSKEATDPNWKMTYGLLALDLSQAGSPISVGGEASTLLYTQLQSAIAREKRLAPPPNFTGGVMKMSDGSVFIPHHAGLEVRPGHRVLGTFWTYMNRKDLFPGGWLHDIGLPISGALEATVVKGNLGQRKITIQAFQRAILTYDPANPAGWQVERANIGSDYATAFPERVPLWSR